MLKANVALFVTMTMMIESLRHTWRKTAPLLTFPGSLLPSLGGLKDEFRRLGLNGSAHQIERIEFASPLWDESATMANIDALWSIFENELDGRLFYAVDAADNLFIESHGLLLDTAARFPRATGQMSEARKCVALDRYDAAVFHSMRALEIALLALAAEFPSVNATKSNWETLLTDIATSVKDMGRCPSKPPNWKELEQFYSEACADFRLFKNAWRNYVMHEGITYGPGEARDVTVRVGKFLDHLATRLEEH